MIQLILCHMIWKSRQQQRSHHPERCSTPNPLAITETKTNWINQEMAKHKLHLTKVTATLQCLPKSRVLEEKWRRLHYQMGRCASAE